MPRIQLRDTKIYLQDGLSGTGAVDDVAGYAIGDSAITVDDIVLNTDVTDQVPVGARLTFTSHSTVYTVTARDPAVGGTTTEITVSPTLTDAVADDEVITFLPQRLEIKIGDGDASWSETRNFEYDLDRDVLDTVRQGEDAPLELDLAFTFEFVTTESGQAITPVDALKRQGEASEWVTSSSDLCEPYATDVYIVHCLPCGSEKDQDFLFPDFRYESLEFSIQDASIAVSGRCNATEATTSRDNFDACS